MLIKNQIIAKFGKKFLNLAKHSTENTKGIHYQADGAVMLTDRHQMLYIKGVSEPRQSELLCFTTGEPLAGVVEAQRFIPSSHKAVIKIYKTDLKRAITSLKAIKSLGRAYDGSLKAGVVSLVIRDSGLFVVEPSNTGHNVLFSLPLGVIESMDESDSLSVNVDFIINALEVYQFIDSDVYIRFNGKFNPILFSNKDEDVQVIALPFRTGN